MTKTTTFINGFLFYFSVMVFAIFLCGGCETFAWYIPTICCILIMWKFSKTYDEDEWKEFTGVNWFVTNVGNVFEDE